MPEHFRRARFIIVSLEMVVAVVASGVAVCGVNQRLAAREPLVARLDENGPYLILVSRAAEKIYAPAVRKARELHPKAILARFDPADLPDALKKLKKHQPRYALVFLKPEELDVNFAWLWLALTTQLNDDPLVDVRTGFITGATPEATTRFIGRIAAAVKGEAKLPAAFIDNLGPNTQAGKQDYFQNPGSFFIPVLAKRFSIQTISHGTAAFLDKRLAAHQGAGMIHLGGHGHPDRVDDGVTGTQAGKLKLAPCVVFNGACYTGVTGRWFDPFTQKGVAEHTVKATDSFCLNMLDNQALGYLAALHVDHGMPVYQEMEFLAYQGASLGDAIKFTHDGVILGSGGKLLKLEPFVAGKPPPNLTASEVMLKGTASRVLFGDPALIVTAAFTELPFKVSVKEGKILRITATLNNSLLKSTFTDTYHADLARDKNLFNDCAYFVAKLPAGWKSIRKVDVLEVKVGNKSLKHRLVGFAVESRDADRYLHVQVDVPTTGFLQSPFRVKGARVEVSAYR